MPKPTKMTMEQVADMIDSLDLTFEEWETELEREMNVRGRGDWMLVLGDFPTRDLYDGGYSVDEGADHIMSFLE